MGKPGMTLPLLPLSAWLAVVVLVSLACAGHAVVVILNLNRLYGLPLPRPFLRLVRRICYLVTLSGPVIFFFAFELSELPILPSPSRAWSSPLAAYGWFCAFLAATWIPVITLVRVLRRTPAQVVEHEARTVDVARELGFAPAGDGKHRRLCSLPFNQVFQVDFVERTLRMPRLPAAWDGLSILHLTDLHFCGTPDKAFYRYVIDRCREWEPDLLALTGDIVDSNKHHRWIVPLLGRLRWRHGAFAVMGNHDAYHDAILVRRRLRRIGFNVLGNSWERLEVHGETMAVIGHEGPWFRPAPDLTGCPSDVFRFCLSHTPDNIRWARQQGIDLMLAGHNHGGQIRFPLFGSLFVPSIYSRRYDCGTFDEAPTLLHVSRGLAGQQPLRFNCRPEVTKFVLKPASTAIEDRAATPARGTMEA
jgi:predicted MPP superfamily phosphohydrolase